mmetsp:Transcript_80326/g.215314  ORF Transcript_80326/g.215314 Transcript_80326/m.215314 type:complete len:129 (+) Transcript_80326:351-737(+)
MEVCPMGANARLLKRTRGIVHSSSLSPPPPSTMDLSVRGGGRFGGPTHLDSAEHGHEDVYPVCRLSVAKHDNHPDHKRDQESKEKNAETDWQGDASGGEHLASPVGQSHMEIVRDHGSFGTVCIDYCV